MDMQKSGLAVHFSVLFGSPHECKLMWGELQNELDEPGLQLTWAKCTSVQQSALECRSWTSSTIADHRKAVASINAIKHPTLIW